MASSQNVQRQVPVLYTSGPMIRGAIRAVARRQHRVRVGRNGEKLTDRRTKTGEKSPYSELGTLLVQEERLADDVGADALRRREENSADMPTTRVSLLALSRAPVVHLQSRHNVRLKHAGRHESTVRVCVRAGEMHRSRENRASKLFNDFESQSKASALGSIERKEAKRE